MSAFIDELEAESRAIHAERMAAFQGLLKANGGTPLGIEVKRHNGDDWGAVFPDASSPGDYRSQRWTGTGFYTHHTRHNPFTALWDLVSDGFTEHAPGALDAMSQTEDWARGLVGLAEIQALNANSWLQSLERRRVTGANDARVGGFPVRVSFDPDLLCAAGNHELLVNAKTPLRGTHGRDWQDDIILAGQWYAVIDPDRDDSDRLIADARAQDAWVIRALPAKDVRLFARAVYERTSADSLQRHPGMWARIIRTAPQASLIALIDEYVMGLDHRDFVSFLATLPDWWRY